MKQKKNIMKFEFKTDIQNVKAEKLELIMRTLCCKL